MQRRRTAAIASLCFAAFWAARAWPWGAESRPARAAIVLWSLCVLFLAVAGGVVAGKRWARWLGLVCAAILLVLLSISLAGAYFLSFFGDQAMGVGIASWFLAAIAFAGVLVASLAMPLDDPEHTAPPESARRPRGVWIPLAFSATYLAAFWLVSIYAGSSDWGLARAITMFVVAPLVGGPSILLVWLAWAWWGRKTPAPPLGGLLAIGVAIPFVVGAVFYAIVDAKATRDQRTTVRQLASIQVSEVSDELLLSARGNPIGIRLRYTMRLGEGLDDIRYRPTASLAFNSPHVLMWQVRSETTPPVQGAFRKGEYRVTEDYIPFYSAGFLRFPGAPQRAEDKCFYWGTRDARALAMDTQPREATISLSLPRAAGPSLRRDTRSALYAQSTFYAGALAEGAVDCR